MRYTYNMYYSTMYIHLEIQIAYFIYSHYMEIHEIHIAMFHHPRCNCIRHTHIYIHTCQLHVNCNIVLEALHWLPKLERDSLQRFFSWESKLTLQRESLLSKTVLWYITQTGKLSCDKFGSQVVRATLEFLYTGSCDWIHQYWGVQRFMCRWFKEVMSQKKAINLHRASTTDLWSTLRRNAASLPTKTFFLYWFVGHMYVYIYNYIYTRMYRSIYIRVYVYFSELDGASCMFDYIFAWRLAGGCWKFTVRAFHLKGNQHITPKRPSIFPAELPSPDILTLTNSGPSKFEDRYQTKWWFGNVSPFRYGQILGINVRLQGGIYTSTVISSDLSTYILGDVEVTLLGEVVVARWCQWTFQA